MSYFIIVILVVPKEELIQRCILRPRGKSLNRIFVENVLLKGVSYCYENKYQMKDCRNCRTRRNKECNCKTKLRSIAHLAMKDGMG
jgi:hypothetical protein